MSCSIYDTSWLSMVSRETNGTTNWTFPESFQYILETQLLSGGWPAYASQVDGILNTMGGLLALLKHKDASTPLLPTNLPWNSELRISRAKESLQIQLQVWDVEACDHVGFEYLVPALMGMLELYGMNFDFPGKTTLLGLNQTKLANFSPKLFYMSIQTTALHSLEAFFSKVDFDRVKHHKIGGGFMGSPASTAAYLISSTAWDLEAEMYLRSVLANGEGKGNGGVPCAFPTTIFEVTWVLSTLLKAGFTTSELGPNNVDNLTNIIMKEFTARHGAVGFAPGMMSDADDTAKSILTLHLLGHSVSPDGMIAKFEADTHFRTYASERNSSFSANCNVLNALLHIKNPDLYAKQILKTTIFLCESWLSGKVTDKWNLCNQYAMMLLAQTFRQLLVLWDRGRLPDLSDQLVTEKVTLVLFQIMFQTLIRQNTDGSWGIDSSCEESSYGILTLVDSAIFQWTECLAEKIRVAIELGRKFLTRSHHQWGDSKYIWVEKVSYKSSLLSNTYSVAASKAAHKHLLKISDPTPQRLDSLRLLSKKILSKFTTFFSKIPRFQKQSKWKLESSIIEGALFVPRLTSIRLDVFPRRNMEKDKYLEYIPFTWTACNNLLRSPLEGDLLWDMMVISMLNFQTDEFMETIQDIQSPKIQKKMRDLISNMFSSPSGVEGVSEASPSEGDNTLVSTAASSPLSLTEKTNDNSEQAPIIRSTAIVLQNFLNYVMNHKNIIHAPRQALMGFSIQLQKFLLAHVDHCSDNAILSQQSQKLSLPEYCTNVSLYDWVQNTAAIDTSCPYAFSWLFCRLATKSTTSSGAVVSYLKQDLTKHLAAMCRMYNDYGSLARDIAESNVNSLNFTEFMSSKPVGRKGAIADGEESKEFEMDASRRKTELMELAEYERSCMLSAKKKLLPLISKREADVLEVFVNVTDLYGQIYVARDIASWMH